MRYLLITLLCLFTMSVHADKVTLDLAEGYAQRFFNWNGYPSSRNGGLQLVWLGTHCFTRF